MTPSSEAPAQQSNATNSQNPHPGKDAHTTLNVTTCTHGTTSSMQFLRQASDADAAALKATGFQNHQRLLPACNCTLT